MPISESRTARACTETHGAVSAAARRAHAGNRLSPLRMCTLLGLAGLVAAIPACGSSGEVKRERIRTIEPGAFLAAEGEAGAVEPLATAPTASSTDSGTAATQTDQLGRGPERYRVVPGAPQTFTEPGRAVEGPQLLDAKVGDVNGRPVFVSEFLEPIQGRLRAEATRLDREPWMREAAGIIQEQMRALITDELLKAEALSRLSVDQKAGLRRFLDDVRRNLLSQNRGSQQLAEERLRREQGLTQEEFLRQNEDRTLVRFTLQEEIQGRINVSWRDILRRYARDDAKYNPDPIARFFILSIRGDDDAGRAELEARFDAGVPFPDIAQSELNRWTLHEGGLVETQFEGSFAGIEPFGPDELNAAASSLGVGERSEAITFGSSLIWIYLDAIDENSTTLYDAQLSISQEIRNERTAVELERYIDRLLGRASVSDVEDMMVRLLQIAAERYGPEPGGRRRGSSLTRPATADDNAGRG